MKNKQIISPIGLKGNQIHERQLSLMGIKPITENENKGNHAVELTKIGPDGNAYAIIRENHEYFIKRTDKTTGLVLEDFKYIGGLQNKKDEAYPSYAKAIKQLNLKFKSLSESYNRGGDINVFEDDNLLEHHPLKADQALSATKGIGDNEEYIVDKKGTPLSNKAKEGKEEGQFGDNVADKKVADEFEKVNESFGMGFTGEGNLEGNKSMVDEVELNEFEAAIEEMMARYDEEKFPDLTGDGKVTRADILKGRGVFEEDDYVDYTMGNEEDPNQLPNPPREINIPENASEGIDHEAYDLVEFLKSKLVERGMEVTPENISMVSLAYPGGTITDLEKISSILSQTNEELHGNQDELDVAEPKGELTKADFDTLNSMEESIKRLDALLEGELKKKALK